MGTAKYAVKRMTVSLGVAALVVAATTPTASADAPPAGSPCPGNTTDCVYMPPPDRVALVLGGTTISTPNSFYLDAVESLTIAPLYPGQNIEYIAVTAPQEFWPTGGLFRVLALTLAVVDSNNVPPGLVASMFPQGYSLVKLTGLFDLTIDESVAQGADALEAEIAKHPDEPLVINGYSQGSVIANVVKRRLAEQYPEGTDAPDIDFVLGADPNLPNGGILARFPGLYIPILNWTFNGPAPTDTQFDTVEINQQYDGFADFPLYPLNLVATVNAVFGIVFVHGYPLDAVLPDDPTSSPAYQGHYGDTDYYFFESENLPLFEPLRIAGVPEPVIDTFEPVVREVVELGYDRDIKPWEPTPARLIPPLNPGTVTADLVNAIGDDITNAAALIGAPPLLSIPTPAATADQDAATEQNFSGPGTDLNTVSRDVGGGVSRVLTAVGSPPEPFAVSQDDLQASQRKVGREPVATNDRINETNGVGKSVIGNGRTIVRSTGSDNGSQTATASPAHKTPVRDAVKNASTDISKAVTKVSDSVK